MRSVRARITITAAVVTAVALAVAALFLLQGLRTSLIEQLDDSIADQVVDLQLNVIDEQSLIESQLNDVGTLQVVLDGGPDEFFFANDSGVRASDVRQHVPLQDSFLQDEPLIVNASITSATETPGADNLRVAVAPLLLFSTAGLDEAFDEDLIIDEASVTYAVVGRVMEPIDETVASTRNRLLLLLPTLVAVVALLAWWLTGRALTPVDRMRREVDEITAGDLRRRISEPSSKDEIGELALTMNRMLGRLHDSNLRQQQFVSDAAHELRTPLTSIAAQLDVDSAHPATADHGATATAVRGEVTRMQALIDGLLTLARGDQGAHGLHPVLLDFDEVARASADRVPRPPNVELSTTGLRPVEVRGDDAALQRIIDNLLANAYRHASSAVRIETASDSSHAWLTVDDDGSGIAADERDVIFDRFVRLDEARTRDAGGSGLGLALSRELARAHGGSLSVADSPLGGARFELRIPLS